MAGTSARTALVVGTLLLVAACGDDDPTDATEEPPDRDGQTFVSSSVTGRSLVADTTIRISFEDEVMAVVAGCNTLTGGYQETDGVLSWTAEPVSTMMMCEPALTEQDAWLRDLLTDGMRVEDDTGDLTLTSDGVTLELTR